MTSVDARVTSSVWQQSRRAEQLLIPATLVTSLGNSIQLTAAAVLMVQSDQSTLAVGWLFVAFSMPQALLSLAFGWLSDRLDRRMLCLLCEALSAVVAAALPVWLALGLGRNVGLYAATFLLATMNALFLPASSALIKERVVDERLGPFNANFEMATQAGTLLSTAIGGMLVQLYGAQPLFLFNAVTFVASAACFAAIGRRRVRLAGAGAAAATGVEQGEPASRAPLVRLGLLYALGHPIITVSNTLIVVLVLQTFRRGPGVLGVVDALAGAGFLVAAALYKRLSRRSSNLRIAFVGYLACAGIVALEPMFDVAGLMLLLPLGALTFGVARISCRTMLMRASPEATAGRVFGAATSFGLAFSVVATVAISQMADRTSVPYAFGALAVLIAATATAVTITLSSPRRRRASTGRHDDAHEFHPTSERKHA